MGQPKKGIAPELSLTIGDSGEIGYMFQNFEWMSFTNGGYVVRARVLDPNWTILKKRLVNDKFLQSARNKPTKMQYELHHAATNLRTGKHIAYLTDIRATGTQWGGGIEFIGVDPPSYWLNAGDSSGKAYKGNVKQVIEKVLQEYFVGPNGAGTVKVSDTDDSKQNLWHMMRMDPKTFIGSLIDFSSSITTKKTNYVVSSSGTADKPPEIWIVEQAQRPTVDYGVYYLDAKTPTANDILNFEVMANPFISPFQTQMITQGMSAISEKYLDRKMDKKREIVHVYDERTPNKRNAKLTAKQSFKKPDNPPGAFEDPHWWSTSILAIPESNSGDLGIKYKDHIDGRARGLYLNMLNQVLRIKIRVTGDASPLLADSHNLGVSKLKIIWKDAFGEDYFADGDWMVYGFHHLVNRRGWWTDLYCARLDFDAKAKPV